MTHPEQIPIELLVPHPKNPRLVNREDVIAAIEQQLRADGFDSSHALIVRPIDEKYQIISGHNRLEASRRAELKTVPAWVREMDDETAFMQLILANSQGELSPLERGMHALAATEKGRHHKSVKAYADAIKRPQQSVSIEVCAARVVEVTTPEVTSDLIRHHRQLAEIHAAPQDCWQPLVTRLAGHGWTVERTRQEIARIKEVKPPRGHEWLFRLEQLQYQIACGHDAAQIAANIVRAVERAKGDIREGSFKAEQYLSQFEAWLKDHRDEFDAKAIYAEGQSLLDAQRKEYEEAQAKAAKLKRPITLTEWKALAAEERELALRVRNEKANLNKQDGDSIEWARWSWNPVTGCNHNCPYCYARDIAERFYKQKFEPSIIPDALSAPLRNTPPDKAETDLGWKNIFTCSMADLFGNWVPAEWINAVLSVVREAKQWNFLFLTKFPQRLKEFDFPDNAWLGTSVDAQARVPIAEKAMRDVKAAVKWVSIEPMIEPISMDFGIFQWIVIGGASESTQTPAWRPPRRWVFDVTARAMSAGCAVYHKTNLNQERLRDYPGSGDQELQRAPEPFHYLKALKVVS